LAGFCRSFCILFSPRGVFLRLLLLSMQIILDPIYDVAIPLPTTYS
jgi:hypothetical protein